MVFGPVVRSDFPGYICSPMEKRVPTPLWFIALLRRVPEVFECHISLHSARSACRLTVLGRTNLRCQLVEEGIHSNSMIP